MLKRLLINVISILILAAILPGFQISSWATAFVVAIVIGLINIFIKPVLFIFTLPITIITLGLFTFILNALMLQLADTFVPGFRMDSFLTAIIASLLMSFINSALESLLT